MENKIKIIMSTDTSYYITSPIYYVNDIPHIGHAYTSLACDVMARFMGLSGKDVKFLTGTDEHGQKVEKSALNAGISPQEFTDRTSESFRALNKFMNYSNNDFIRTTEERHKNAVQIFWSVLKDKEYIYLGKYSGWYSVRDEAFYAESELTEDGRAPTGAPVEWVEEPSYFFALSKFQDKLLEFYEKNPDFIKPETRRNEVISFVKGGLNDLSISRTSFKWGIKVPGDEDHIIYVWLDALVNYISALGYGSSNKADYNKYWPANAHIVGKDILRFHAVYWPAFLMAADLPLPKTIVAHGWWTNEGEKISKSLGNVINPKTLVDEFGLDQVRYFLMREVIFGNDGNYAKDNLVQRNNSELANKIGNLIQRTCAFVYKNCERTVPNVSEQFIDELYKTEYFQNILSKVVDNSRFMEEFKINSVLDNIIQITEQANLFIDQAAPWNLKNSDPEKMDQVLYQLLETIRFIGIMLQPFVPNAAEQILNQLLIDNTQRNFSNLTREFAIKCQQHLQEPKAIFPRI